MKPSPLNGKTLLVVDDDVELRRAMLFDLKRRGCVIFEAGSGAEALEVVKNNRIEIVISDICMPNGTGVDLLKELRAIHPDIPIVLLATGFADFSEPEAVKLGAYALLEKPIDRKRMIGLLESSCEQLQTAP